MEGVLDQPVAVAAHGGGGKHLIHLFRVAAEVFKEGMVPPGDAMPPLAESHQLAPVVALVVDVGVESPFPRGGVFELPGAGKTAHILHALTPQNPGEQLLVHLPVRSRPEVGADGDGLKDCVQKDEGVVHLLPPLLQQRPQIHGVMGRLLQPGVPVKEGKVDGLHPVEKRPHIRHALHDDQVAGDVFIVKVGLPHADHAGPGQILLPQLASLRHIGVFRGHTAAGIEKQRADGIIGKDLFVSPAAVIQGQLIEQDAHGDGHMISPYPKKAPYDSDDDSV